MEKSNAGFQRPGIWIKLRSGRVVSSFPFCWRLNRLHQPPWLRNLCNSEDLDWVAMILIASVGRTMSTSLSLTAVDNSKGSSFATIPAGPFIQARVVEYRQLNCGVDETIAGKAQSFNSNFLHSTSSLVTDFYNRFNHATPAECLMQASILDKVTLRLSYTKKPGAVSQKSDFSSYSLLVDSLLQFSHNGSIKPGKAASG